MKGSISNFSAKRAFQAAIDLEKAAENEDLEEIKECLADLESELDSLRAALEEWLNMTVS